MVLLYHMPILVGRRGVIYLFKLFLPANTGLGAGGGRLGQYPVSTRRDALLNSKILFVRYNDFLPLEAVGLVNVNGLHVVREAHARVCLRQADQGLQLPRVRRDLNTELI
jgi:hypothetical protein